MGVMRKTVIGSLLVGLGSVALAQKKKVKKTSAQISQRVAKEVHKVMRNGARKHS